MRKIRLLFFPMIFIFLCFYLFMDNYAVFNNPDNVAKLYVHNLKKGYLSYGIEANYDNRLSLTDLELGDIIVGGYPECAYGRFTHAGIYIGDNLVMESYGDLGVTVQPLEHYGTYKDIALLRVEADPLIKKNAVEYVENYIGGLFHPLAFKPGDRMWNCTKIIWRAYYVQGVDLDANNDLWVTPEAFYDSPWTTVIRENPR